ncbi:MAG: DUF599 family protein [Candidatus Lokiarchaeota archaeon]|nr:DUF599 family protein [Candidatus Lokiarchaeota archaeon]
MLHEIGLIFFASCFIVYFLLLYNNLRRRKKPNKFHVFRLIYINWVQTRVDDNSSLAGVQALRNFIMANSTFVSALFILLGILVGFYNATFFDNMSFFGLSFITVGLVQITLNLLVIVFCLFNFILSIRYTARLSILITGKPHEYAIGKVKGIEVTTKTLLSAQNHWMLGVRSLFYLIATLIWFVSPILLIVATIAVTFYLLALHDIV